MKTNLEWDELKALRKLTNRKNILAAGKYLVEGINVINEGLKHRQINELLISDKRLLSTYENKYPKVEITIVTGKQLQQLSKLETPPGIIGIAKPQDEKYDLEKLAIANKIIVLDQIADPGNFGTIIRTALAFDFDLIISFNSGVSKYNDKVIRSSQGAVFQLPIIETNDLTLLNSFSCYYFVLDETSKNFNDIDFNIKRLALVFGNESHGISKDLLATNPGTKVYIKIKNIDSLNLAITAGIAMGKVSC